MPQRTWDLGMLLAVAVAVAATLARADPTCATHTQRSPWADVPMGKPDKILGLNQAFKDDASPDKMNLGVGAYRDAEGRPRVLDVVREAERRMAAADLNKEYAPIGGLSDFLNPALRLMYGSESSALREGRLARVQAISGTGACRLAGELYRRTLGEGTPVLLPNPTWPNHVAIFRDAGLDVRSYRYWSAETLGLDIDGMVKDIAEAPAGSIVLLHACAHNPTGVDPTREQWLRVAEAVEQGGHVVLFDSAYQGFASGDPDADAFAVRLFEERGHRLTLAQSFAKNFGLYGERVGSLSVVTDSPDEAQRVESLLRLIIRPMYSNPPIHGARIVATVLNDDVRAPVCRCRSRRGN